MRTHLLLGDLHRSYIHLLPQSMSPEPRSLRSEEKKEEKNKKYSGLATGMPATTKAARATRVSRAKDLVSVKRCTTKTSNPTADATNPLSRPSIAGIRPSAFSAG